MLLARKIVLERSAPPLVAVNKNETAGLSDDAVDRRQAEPGARPDLLGREERLENAGEMLLRNADPGIGYLDQHIVAARHDLVAAAHWVRLAEVVGADRRCSAA